MNFFLKNFKTRKVVFFAFLFLAIFSFAFLSPCPAFAQTNALDGLDASAKATVNPQTGSGVHAATPDANAATYCSSDTGFFSGAFTECNCTPQGKCVKQYGLSTKFEDGCHTDADCIVGDMIAGPGSGPDSAENADFGWNVKGLVVGLARFFLWLAWVIAGWCASLFLFILDWSINQGITTNALFTPGWTKVRDLANMLIVLGFVIVGIATSLRLREYEAKKLLWPLILAALLVNFSGLFCGLIIDASQLTMKYFTQGSGSTGISIVSGLEAHGREAWTQNYVQNNAMTFVWNSLLAAALYVAVAITYLYISVILIIRYAILAMLFILSPIAFTFWVFPASKKLWTEWWSHFIRWAFVGAIAGFFLAIATPMLEPVKSPAAASSWALIVGLVFVIVGFKMSSKTSGIASMASGAILGLAGGAAGLALGAVGKVGGGVVNKFGASRAGNWVKDRAGMAAEKLGLRQEGTTSANAAKRTEEKQKSVGGLSFDRQAQLASRSRPVSENAALDKVTAIKSLADKGELHRLGDTSKQHQALAYVESYEKSRGISSDTRKKAVEHNAELAAADDRKVGSYATGHGMSFADAHTKIVQNQMVSNFEKGTMSAGDINRINPVALDYDFVKENFNAGTAKKFGNANAGLQAQLKSHTERLRDDAEAAQRKGDNTEANRLNKVGDTFDRY